MPVILHQLPDGRWRVTDAPDGWQNDGRDYPAPSDSDAVFAHQDEAIRDYLERTTPRDPSDEIADADADEPLY